MRFNSLWQPLESSFRVDKLRRRLFKLIWRMILVQVLTIPIMMTGVHTQRIVRVLLMT